MEAISLIVTIIAALLIGVVIFRTAIYTLGGLFLICFFFWPSLLGIIVLVLLWQQGNNNIAVFLFIGSLVGNFYWAKLNEKKRWVTFTSDDFRSRDTRSELDVLKDIERKLDDR